MVFYGMALAPLKEIPEWWELCERYRYDIYAFAVEALGVEPMATKLLLNLLHLMVAVLQLRQVTVALEKGL